VRVVCGCQLGGASDSKGERIGVKDIPPDENLKARSYVPAVPTVALVDLCPNYNDRLPNNVYRESLLACLSWDDERVVFGALAMIRSLMQVWHCCRCSKELYHHPSC
jgi:hypothetical protein